MYFDLLLPYGTIQHSYTRAFAEPSWVQGLQFAFDERFPGGPQNAWEVAVLEVQRVPCTSMAPSPALNILRYCAMHLLPEDKRPTEWFHALGAECNDLFPGRTLEQAILTLGLSRVQGFALYHTHPEQFWVQDRYMVPFKEEAHIYICEMTKSDSFSQKQSIPAAWPYPDPAFREPMLAWNLEAWNPMQTFNALHDIIANMAHISWTGHLSRKNNDAPMDLFNYSYQNIRDEQAFNMLYCSPTFLRCNPTWSLFPAPIAPHMLSFIAAINPDHIPLVADVLSPIVGHPSELIALCLQSSMAASDVSNAFVEWLGTLSQPNTPLNLPIDLLAPR